MTDPTTPAPLTDNELAAIRTHTRAYLPSTEDAPILVEAATDRRRLLDEVGRLRASLDRAKAAAAWERGQRRSQSSTLGVKIDQLGIARAEKAALAARLAEAEQARDEARDEAAHAWSEGHAAAMAAMLDERDSLTAQLAAVRELARRWQRDAHKRREIADARPGLTQIERAEIRQAATEIEQCARGLHRTLGPDTASHGPATATGAPGPDPSEGTAPTSRPGGTQRPHETPCLDSPAPLTLDQAAGHLHDWARDLADGTRTDWPAGHADVIRGIRAAADWLTNRLNWALDTLPHLTPTHTAYLHALDRRLDHLNGGTHKPTPIDGVPCRECNRYSLIRHSDTITCTAHDCRCRMSPDEYTRWTKLAAAHAQQDHQKAA